MIEKFVLFGLPKSVLCNDHHLPQHPDGSERLCSASEHFFAAKHALGLRAFIEFGTKKHHLSIETSDAMSKYC